MNGPLRDDQVLLIVDTDGAAKRMADGIKQGVTVGVISSFQMGEAIIKQLPPEMRERVVMRMTVVYSEPALKTEDAP